MNANAVARHYASLTPEERFCLILAASGRGDEAERDRLANAGKRITLSMADHAPYAHAFDELSFLTFLELLESVALYRELLDRAEKALDESIRDSAGEVEGVNTEDGEEVEDDDRAEVEPDESPAEEEDTGPAWDRMLQIAYAAGFVLRMKANGWKLFCEQMNVPPFLMWRLLPGFDRLLHALAVAEKASFVAEGFLSWLNRIRPPGEPEVTRVSLAADSVAAEAEELFRDRVKWWGG